MKIKESQNLKYDKISSISTGGDAYDRLDFQPEVCVLEEFNRVDEVLILHFKNKTHASIQAKTPDGVAEIDFIETLLPDMVGKSYAEILETEI